MRPRSAIGAVAVTLAAGEDACALDERGAPWINTTRRQASIRSDVAERRQKVGLSPPTGRRAT